jgi:hypothetical protein
MITPRDNSSDILSRSTIELIHHLLNIKHPDFYQIYSLDQTYSQKEYFHNRV